MTTAKNMSMILSIAKPLIAVLTASIIFFPIFLKTVFIPASATSTPN